MDAAVAHQINGAAASDAIRSTAKPKDDAERIVWSHAFWARLNHEQEKFTPSVAKACADEVLRHAREAGVIETMATALRGSTK